MSVGYLKPHELFGKQSLATTISVMSWCQSKTLCTAYLSTLLGTGGTCRELNLGWFVITSLSNPCKVEIFHNF